MADKSPDQKTNESGDWSLPIPPGMSPVTDPEILAQLNGELPYNQPGAIELPDNGAPRKLSALEMLDTLHGAHEETDKTMTGNAPGIGKNQRHCE